MNAGLKKYWLTAEFIILFFGIPLLLYFDSVIVHPSSVLIPLLAVILILLRYRTDFRWKDLVYLKITGKDIMKHLIILSSIFLFLLAIVLIFIPDRLFNLPRGSILIWILLSVFYPVFSAYAQEVIYRTFLFNRYSTLFTKPWMMILASAVAFSYVHIVYYSTVSIILTFFGGLYLAKTYFDTRSVLLTSILHGLMGDIVFAVGMGEFFWLDMYDYLG